MSTKIYTFHPFVGADCSCTFLASIVILGAADEDEAGNKALSTLTDHALYPRIDIGQPEVSE